MHENNKVTRGGKRCKKIFDKAHKNSHVSSALKP